MPRQKNGQVGQYNTTAKVPAAREMSTCRGATARRTESEVRGIIEEEELSPDFSAIASP